MSELWNELDFDYDYDDPYGDGDEDDSGIALDENGETVVKEEDDTLTGFHIVDEEDE